MVEEDARVAGGDWSASRRQFLKYGTLGLILPAAFLQACGEADRTTLEAMLGYGNDARTFSPEAKRTVQAIAERLVPSDETGPGAREAMAWRYIDRALAGELEPERGLYDEGLPALDAFARERHGSAFAELEHDQQDEVLRAVEAGEPRDFPAPGAAAFFATVRQHVLQGTFGDPFHGGNANFVGWDLIGFSGVNMIIPAAYQAMGARVPKAHRSVAQFPMFDYRPAGSKELAPPRQRPGSHQHA